MNFPNVGIGDLRKLMLRRFWDAEFFGKNEITRKSAAADPSTSLRMTEGNGIARTRAFPNGVWERGEGMQGTAGEAKLRRQLRSQVQLGDEGA
jgi:hypothetical protein